MEPSRRNSAGARAARETQTQPSQPPRPRREPSRNPQPAQRSLPSSTSFAMRLPPSPHKCRASGRPAARHSERTNTQEARKALARRKRRERGGGRRPGTRGPHRPPVADAIRPRGFFKLWWWLVCLICALLLFSARRTVSAPPRSLRLAGWIWVLWVRPIAVASAGFVRQIMLCSAFLGKFSCQILGVHGSWLPAITEGLVTSKFSDFAA